MRCRGHFGRAIFQEGLDINLYDKTADPDGGVLQRGFVACAIFWATGVPAVFEMMMESLAIPVAMWGSELRIGSSLFKKLLAYRISTKKPLITSTYLNIPGVRYFTSSGCWCALL